MEEIKDMEYVTLKALSEKVISGVSPAVAKITKEAEKLAEEISEVETKLQGSSDLREIAKLSALSDEKREKIFSLIAIKGRLDGLINRNKSRIAYFDKVLKARGIYQSSFDKKLLSSMEEQEKENISEKSLNLNKTLNTPVPKFIFGQLLYFKGKVLDFSLDKNKDIIVNADEALIRNILSDYPQSIATITPEELAHTSFKRKLLKELTYYIGAGIRDKSLAQINEALGEPLCFKSSYTNTLSDYIMELQNSYNVQVKRYLKARFPEHAEDIDSKLECDESSQFLYEPSEAVEIQEDKVEIPAAEEEKTAAPEPEEGFKEEKLSNGAVRKSMVSKDLTEAFSDTDAEAGTPKPTEQVEEEEAVTDIDKELLELYGIEVGGDDDDEEE